MIQLLQNLGHSAGQPTERNSGGTEHWSTLKEAPLRRVRMPTGGSKARSTPR
jgi:hypothetical protein